jgi:NADPH-dependent 2,4-dienoyl-CoA reductase/sulfur reductase-like enzyme
MSGTEMVEKAMLLRTSSPAPATLQTGLSSQEADLTTTRKSRPHAVVIGGGFGGLFAAIRLGARGYRVMVLEKLDAPGVLSSARLLGAVVPDLAQLEVSDE